MRESCIYKPKLAETAILLGANREGFCKHLLREEKNMWEFLCFILEFECPDLSSSEINNFMNINKGNLMLSADLVVK